MNESKRQLSATVKIIDILLEQKRITNDQGTSVSGGYWFDIKMSIRDKCHADIYKDGLSCIFQESLLSYKEKCIESKLDEKYKLVNIKYVKRAYIISIISIITSIVSMIISAIAIAR